MTVASLTWPYVERSIEELVATFERLDERGRAWQPDVPDANSVATLVGHTISNAEDNLLGRILGREVRYDRERDFDAPEASPEAVRDRWERLRTDFSSELASLTDERLFETVQHPRRGPIARLDALIVVTRHAAEHLAQAQLTRDLYHASEGDRR